MNSCPVVSIACVTYNHGAFIRQCLSGFVMQKTTFPIEIVLGEDCSSDDTRSIVKEFEEAYPHLFRVFYHPVNQGAQINAYDFVIPSCQGKYIAFCEGDDYWIDEYKLQKQYDLLEANQDLSFTFHNAKIFDSVSNCWEGNTNPDDQKNRVTLHDISFQAFIYSPTMFLRAELLKKFPSSKKKYLNNRTIEIYLAHFGDAVYLPDIMAVYRKHPGGVWSSKKRIDILNSQLPIYEFYLNNFSKDYKHHYLINLRNMTRDLLILSGIEKRNRIRNYAFLKYMKYHGYSLKSIKMAMALYQNKYNDALV